MELGRDATFKEIRRALNRTAQQPAAVRPASVHVRSRAGGTVDEELDQLLSNIRALGGKTRRLIAPLEVESALGTLVNEERVRKATIWRTKQLGSLHIGESLTHLNVELVPARAGKQEIAACDLGITEVDAALAESGTLVLASEPNRPATTSLLPRIHLAIMRPAALSVDLRETFDELKQQKHFVLVSGPSRTTDIEKVLALGVHGPKELHVWCLG